MSCLAYFRPGTKRRILAGDEPKWIARHPRGSYIRQAILSFPPWSALHAEEFERLKDECRRMGRELDHIIPLKHPRVCGLSVPWNFKAVPRGQNLRKNNSWCQHHGQLFEGPEQLTLKI